MDGSENEYKTLV